MTTSFFLPMILLAVFAVGAALVAGYLILRSGPKEKPASNQRPPNQPTGEWLNREGRPISRRNADLSWKKFGSASMILVGTFSTGAIVAIFVGAIVVYRGLMPSQVSTCAKIHATFAMKTFLTRLRLAHRLRPSACSEGLFS